MVNEWTRDDLPDRYDLQRLKSGIVQPFFFDDILDAVVEHLNANHQKPTPGLLSNAADCVLGAEDRVSAAKSDADRWRRAHEIVEQERDQARERLREACKVAQSYKVDAYHATERAEAAGRERDELQAKLDSLRVTYRNLDARANKIVERVAAAERERDEVQGRADQLRDERDNAVQSCITVGRDRDEWKARAEAAEQYAQAVSDSNRDNADRASKFEKAAKFAWGVAQGWRARAEAAEARTAPSVTRAGVKNAIDTCFALAPKINTQVISDAVCDFLGVEADPVVDPVLDKARELWDVARPSDDVMWRDLTSEAQQEYRRIAAHVLGQEAGDERS